MDRQSQQENREKVLTERSTEADEPLSEEQAEGSVQHSHGEIWPRSESIETRKRILGSEQARATLELGVRTLPDKFALLRAMKVGSLFTGAGSVERVARIMGNECTFGAEIEPWKREWAAKEYNIHMFDDVYNLKACEDTECDIAVSGSPCQSVSPVGLQQGTQCPNGQLLFDHFPIAWSGTSAGLFLTENSDHLKKFTGFKASVPDQSFQLLQERCNISDDQLQNIKLQSEGIDNLVEVIIHFASAAGWNLVSMEDIDSQYFDSAQSRKRTWALYSRRDHDVAEKFIGYQLPKKAPNHRIVTVAEAVRQEGVMFPEEHRRIEEHRIQHKPVRLRGAYDQAWNAGSIDGRGGVGTNIYSMQGPAAAVRATNTSVAGAAGAYVHEDGVFKLGPTVAAALMGFPTVAIEGLSDNKAFDLLGNSMVTNVVVVLLTSIQEVFTGPQDTLLASNEGDESNFILLADSMDIPDKTVEGWREQIGDTKPIQNLQMLPYELGNIQVEMPKPDVPVQIEVPEGILGVPVKQFWTQEALRQGHEWLAQHTRYLVLGLNNAKQGETSRVRAPQPFVMQPKAYARPEYVPYLEQGVVFDLRDGTVRQMESEKRVNRDYDAVACFEGINDVWVDEDIRHTLENGVGLFTNDAAPTLMLGPMQKNLGGNVGQADSQLLKDVAKQWGSFHDITKSNFTPMAPMRCDPMGAAPKKHFGEFTGENRPTTNKSYHKGAHVLSSNDEIDRERLAPMTMTNVGALARSGAILATTGEQVYVMAGDLKSAFRQLPYTEEALYSSGTAWATGWQDAKNVTEWVNAGCQMMSSTVRSVFAVAHRMQFGGAAFPAVYAQLGSVIVMKIRREFQAREASLQLPQHLVQWIERRKQTFNEEDVNKLHGGNWQISLAVVALFVDDIAAAVVGLRRMLRLKMVVCDTLKLMGLPLAAEKWQLGQRALYLGMGVDMGRGIQFIPDRRKVVLMDQLKKWIDTEKAFQPFPEFHSFLCHLNFVIHLVQNGRLIMQRAWKLCHSTTRMKNNQVFMTEKVRIAMRRVREALSRKAVIPLEPLFDWKDQLTSKDYPVVASDASMLGLGGICGQVYWSVKLTKDQANYISMPAKEALATLCNLAVGGKFIEHSRLHIAVLELVDCTAVEIAINNNHAKSTQLAEVLDKRNSYLEEYNIVARAKYVMSKDHVNAKDRERTSGIVAIDVADALSRVYSTDPEPWKKKAELFLAEAQEVNGSTTPFLEASVPADILKFADELVEVGRTEFPEGLLRE